MNLDNAKIAMIIAYRDFQDEEYFIPKNIFEQSSIKVFTVSKEADIAIGVQGGEAKIDIAIDNFNVSDFDAIVFIGGQGAIKYLDNDKSYAIARKAIEQNKILAAICISPIILAQAGVLQGKNATVWSSRIDRMPIRILEKNGVQYKDEQVVVDNKIITGNGPPAACEFAKAIVNKINFN
jgi:protease I